MHSNIACKLYIVAFRVKHEMDSFRILVRIHSIQHDGTSIIVTNTYGLGVVWVFDGELEVYHFVLSLLQRCQGFEVDLNHPLVDIKTTPQVSCFDLAPQKVQAGQDLNANTVTDGAGGVWELLVYLLLTVFFQSMHFGFFLALQICINIVAVD